MIELNTDTDFLIKLSDDMEGSETARDVRMAAHDIKNLRDYAESLERSINQMSGQINSIRTQRDEAAAALLAIFRPELEKMIDDALEYCRPLEDLRDRVERLEGDQTGYVEIRDTVRDMIRDGDIIVSIDHS